MEGTQDQPSGSQAHGTAVGRRRDFETQPRCDHRAGSFQGRSNQGPCLAGATDRWGTAQDQTGDRRRNRPALGNDDQLTNRRRTQPARLVLLCQPRSQHHDPFTSRAVLVLTCNYKLTSRTDRLRAKGMLNIGEMAELIGTKPNPVDYWRVQVLFRGARLNNKKQYLYERPDPDTVQTIQRRTRLNRAQSLS